MHKGLTFKSLMVKSGLVAFACTVSICAYAMADTPKRIDVPGGDLAKALELVSKQAGVELVFRPEQIKGLHTNGLSGIFSSQDAVKKLLEGTSLRLRTDDATGAMMIGAPGPKSGIRNTTRLDVRGEGGADEDASLRLSQQSSFWNRFRVAQVAQESKMAGTPSPSQMEREGERISEIVVTAQKREERLQDVPVSVTALDAQALSDNGQVLLRDYSSSVPGFRVTPSGQGYQYLSIRGIVTGGTVVPTVGVVIDDVPYGSSIANASGVPDIDPGDLARIEVLRGPQGTLYGANSIGGLVKFVTKDPDPSGYSGRIEAGTSYVQNGAEPGFNLRASANLPISDSLAMRVSGFTRQDAGYIDNPVLNINGINESQTYGARWAALWRPSEDFALRLSALYQKVTADGVSQVSLLPTLGDLQQSFPAGVGGYDRSVQAYSATINYKLGKADLTAVTGFNSNRFSDSLDLTYAYGTVAKTVFGGTGAGLYDDFLAQKFTQELRLAMPIGQSFDWLVGAFYTHEHIPNHQLIGAVNATTGRLDGVLGVADYPNIYTEYAGFTDLTWHVTDRFDVQIGGRESRITVSNSTATSEGPVFAPGLAPVISPGVSSKADAFTYLLTPSFRLSPDLMIYARLASGYRPGGPNSFAAVSQGASQSFDPDKTNNYEIGTKGDFLDHKLSIDASLYHIDWKHIQLKLNTPVKLFGYQGNGGTAKSEGVEFSVVSRPLSGLTVSAWVDYDDAAITDVPPLTPIYLYPGDRLAYSSRWSGSASAEQDFPLWDGATGFIRGQADYVGDRLGIFTTSKTAPRLEFPGYTQTNLSVGTKAGSWTASLYANNLADKRGLIGGGFSPPTAVIYIQPRTIGLSVSKTL